MARLPARCSSGAALLATMAGAGGCESVRSLGLERRQVNIARGTLELEHTKTDAGVRVIDLTPALRDELARAADDYAMTVEVLTRELTSAASSSVTRFSSASIVMPGSPPVCSATSISRRTVG
jgi:hypothetical protein